MLGIQCKSTQNKKNPAIFWVGKNWLTQEIQMDHHSCEKMK
jgi:hypothetical protein